MFVVALLRHGVAAVIVVGHAPQSCAPENAKDEFWSALNDTVASLRSKYPTDDWMGFIDANGRVGSIANQNVGPSVAACEDPNGCRLRCSMAAGGFYLVSTFGLDSDHTWCSSRFTWSRID